MAQWSENRVLPSQINDGNEYTINDDLSLEAINAIVNNSLYASKQTVQVSTMPTASQDYLNKIVQYTGTTDSTYTNGYFYKCVENSGTYSWTQTNVQSSNVTSVNGKTGAVVLDADDIDDTNTDNKFVSSTDISNWNAKSTVSVSNTGTATDKVNYITVNGIEKKLAGGVEINEVIESAQSLPTATEQTADFVNIIGGNEDGKLYRKKASADWDETTVAGMTWRFNFSTLYNPGPAGNFTYNITFESNGETFNSLQGVLESSSYNYGLLNYGNQNVVYYSSGWTNQNYKTIKITGGNDVTNSSLISWLKTYATIVEYASENYSYTGIQDEITSNNKLSADLLQDGSTNKVFTETEQSKLAGIESGAEVNDITDVQVNGNSVVTNKVANITVPTSAGVSSLGGATGDIILGSGLTMSGNVLSATGGGAGISQSEVINRPNSLPVASASSPDFVQVDGVTYQKKVSSRVPSTITDLTGTTWVFNNSISYDWSLNSEISINFISNHNNYSSFEFYVSQDDYYLRYKYPIVNAFNFSTEFWLNGNYKTIEITGGIDSTNNDLISWLQNNATIQPVTTYEYVKVVSDNELIQNKQPLTTPTATSPDIIQINGQVYYKKVTENITSLADSTWIFNDDLGDLPTKQFNINFSSNSTNYDGIRITTSTVIYGVSSFDTVYSQDAWQNNSYKTISIVDGTDVADSDFIAWLKANASRQSGGTVTISYSYEKVGTAGSAMEVLWENSSPTSAFTAQTITLTNNDCDFFLIQCRVDGGNAQISDSLVIKVGETGILTLMAGNYGLQQGQTYLSNRLITASTQTSITFSDAWNVGGGSSTNSTHNIPVRVLGIKL